MKLTFKRTVDCDFFDHRLNESYPKVFHKWNEVKVEAIEDEGPTLNAALFDGDTIMNVPKSAVEISR